MTYFFFEGILKYSKFLEYAENRLKISGMERRRLLHLQCLDVGVASFGRTKKEALAMLQDALQLYFADVSLPKKTERVKNPVVASVRLQYA